jgi:type VI protein secretion system component Hcp
MSDEPKKDEQVPKVKTEPTGESLSESELEQVAGGDKATFHELNITHTIDKSSPVLLQYSATDTKPTK